MVEQEQKPRYGRLTKELMFKELASLFEQNDSIFVVGGEKLPTQEVESLRKALRHWGARYLVAKNALCQRLFKEKSLDSLLDTLEGHTALVFGSGDPTVVAKAIVGFAKNHQTFNIRKGFISGQTIDPAGITDLASLPSREILITKVVMGMKAPMAGLVFTLSGLLRQLVTVLERVKEKK